MKIRVGQGFDIHRCKDGDNVVLGGVVLPSSQALEGHSDADVVLHALMDALLGAAGRSDIGTLFPNTDEQLRGISSMLLLERVWASLREDGWTLGNADISVIAEAPKIAPYTDQMKSKISSLLEVGIDQIGIKATTAEKLGSLGRGEGIAAFAVVLLFAS